MSESTEVAVAQSTAVAIPSRSERAASIASRVNPVAKFIRIAENDTGLSIPNLGDTEGPIDVVILEFIAKNVYYDPNVPYQPGVVTPPLCAAMGFEANDDLTPFADAQEPQHETCKGCPQNEFGSGATGKNKACQTRRLVAVMAPDARADDDIFLVDVSPTGIQHLDKALTQITGPMALEPHQCLVEIAPVKAGGSRQKTIAFRMPRPLDKAEGIDVEKQQAIFDARLEEAATLLAQKPRLD